jgi:hypothetical protein
MRPDSRLQRTPARNSLPRKRAIIRVLGCAAEKQGRWPDEMRRRILITVIAIASLRTAVACSVNSMLGPADMLEKADLVLRATALDYARPPADTRFVTTGTPDSVVAFRVEERVKGRKSPTEISLPGYVGQTDEFNDGPVPYAFVRRSGRRGSCYANTYRRGAEYLLFLKLVNGEYTVNWSPLGPTNEQITGPNDPWLKWVRKQVAPQ